MTPKTRRVVYALLYETIAIAVVAPTIALFFEESMTSTMVMAIFMSLVALMWSYIFNSLFERWEAKQQTIGRSLRHRLLHGLGFEGGLVVILVPVMAYWLNTTLINAFILDLGFLLFFVVYTVVFTWVFDRIFGLPESISK